MDVKTDKYGYVYATGWFSGNIQFTNVYTTLPINLDNGYLVCFDPCGNVMWDQQIACTGNCHPTALCIDASNNIIVVGYYYNTITFPGGPFLTQSADAQAFVAKFDSYSGICLWAAKIDEFSAKDINIKDVTSDINNDIFILGDFYGVNLTFYDVSGVPFGTTLNSTPFGISDNYLAVYSGGGTPLYCGSNLLSTVLPDKAGGICCAQNQSISPLITDIYITGQWNLSNFLGQHYEWQHSPPTMTWTTNYQINNPNGFGQEGTSVAIFDDQFGNRSISFSGTQTDFFGTYPVFTHRNLVTPYPLNQLLPTIDLITTTPNFSNFTTDIAINPYSGEMYVAGEINDQGDVPANPPCVWHPTTNLLNGHDMFYFSFGDDPLCPIGVYDKCILHSGTIASNFPLYGCDEKINGVCANMDATAQNTSFITGSFSGTKTEIIGNGPYSMYTHINSNIPFGLDCYISRVYYFQYGTYQLKDNEINSQANGVLNVTDNYSFYPNPANNSLNLIFTGGLNANVKVNLLDITGNYLGNLYQGNLNSNSTIISLEGIIKGAYLIQFESEGKIVCKKLIVL